MSDDLKNKGPADRSRINVNEEWEVKYWTKTLNTTSDKLKAAVKAVGVTVDKLRNHLNGK